VFLLVGGEVGPRDTLTSSFSSIMILIGSVITAVMFGEMAVLMNNISVKATKFQAMQDSANTTMKNMGLPVDL